MIKLYGVGLSFNVSKVRYCLNYLGLKYEWVQTNPIQGENQAAQFVKDFPTGKVPGIDIDGFKLFESNAIIRYLAAANQSPIYPKDAKKRALIDAWLDYVSIHVGHALGRVLFNRVFAPMTSQKVDESSLQTGLDFLAKYFPILEKQLSHKTEEERKKMLEEEVKKYKDVLSKRNKSIDELVKDEEVKIKEKINEFIEKKHADKNEEEKG